MKKILPALLLTLASGSALAGWSPVQPDNGIFSAYADLNSIKRIGGKASMAGLYDFRKGDLTPEGKSFFSTTVLREYDCEARKVRLLSHVDFSEPMGVGTAVSAGARPGRWEKVMRGAVDEVYWKVACGITR